jgi:hypothetical protein
MDRKAYMEGDLNKPTNNALVYPRSDIADHMAVLF